LEQRVWFANVSFITLRFIFYSFLTEKFVTYLNCFIVLKI
jgi:hypothetical protein